MDSYVTMIKAMFYSFIYLANLHFITLTFGAAVIGNDKIILGIDDFGALSAPYESVFGLPATDPNHQGTIGIRSRENGLEGGWVEGWGVYVAMPNLFFGTDLWGGAYNLITLPFTGTSGGDNAVAHVRDTTGSFEVVHDFFPDPISQFAMKIEVTITNISPNNWNSVLYRRVMHTDTITTDGQHVDTILTMQGTATPSVVATSTNPWQETDPSTHDPDGGCGINVFNQDFNRVGPCYFGFAADFEVGPLNSGENVTFGLWYGGAATAEQVQSELSLLCGGGPQFYVFAERDGFTYTFFMAYVESIQLITCPETAQTACPDCCTGTESSECDDSDPCTSDTCINLICNYEYIDGCCRLAQDCDNYASDACKVDYCDTLTGACDFTQLSIPDECCYDAAQCNGGGTCEIGYCVNSVCDYRRDPTCCINQADCDDGLECTTDACASNTCQNTPVPNCCDTAGDCNDIDPCTLDFCTDNVCSNIAITNCCENTVDCQNNLGECYQCISDTCSRIAGCDPCLGNGDCSDGLACTDDSCNTDTNVCEYPLVADPCCSDNPLVDCNDNNPCTTDRCETDGSCSNDVIANCCVKEDSECVDTHDGEACILAPICNTETHTCVFFTDDDCCEDSSDCSSLPLLPGGGANPNNYCQEYVCAANECVQQPIDGCCIVGKSINWHALQNGDDTQRPNDDGLTIAPITNALGFSFDIILDYLGSSYDPNTGHYGLGTTYILDFQPFKEITPSFAGQIGSCQNRLFADFDGADWTAIWQYDNTYGDDIVVGEHATNLAYPAVPKCWQIDVDSECKPDLYYVGSFPWSTLSHCYGSTGERLIRKTETNDHIVISGTFYVSVVSPYQQSPQINYYRILPLIQQDFEIKIVKTINALSSTNIQLFIASIIGLYESSAGGDFFINVLIQSVEYLRLIAQDISEGIIFGGDQAEFLTLFETTGGECLQGTEFTCGQIFTIQIPRDRVICNGVTNIADFSGLFELIFYAECRHELAFGVDSSVCDEWDERTVEIDVASNFEDMSCDPLVYEVAFDSRIAFYYDVDFQIPAPGGYVIGQDRIYVKVHVLIPCDDYCDGSVNIFRVLIDNVFICTVESDDSPLQLVDPQTALGNPGGCLDPNKDIDGPYAVILNGASGSATLNYEAKIHSIASNTEIGFSFLTPPVGREILWVHVQAYITLHNGQRRRVLLQATTFDPSSNTDESSQIRHFTANTRVINEEESNTSSSHGIESISSPFIIAVIVCSLIIVLVVIGFIIFTYVTKHKSTVEKELKELNALKELNNTTTTMQMDN